MSLLIDGQLSARETDVRVPGGLRLGRLGLTAFVGLRQQVSQLSACRVHEPCRSPRTPPLSMDDTGPERSSVAPRPRRYPAGLLAPKTRPAHLGVWDNGVISLTSVRLL